MCCLSATFLLAIALVCGVREAFEEVLWIWQDWNNEAG